MKRVYREAMERAVRGGAGVIGLIAIVSSSGCATTSGADRAARASGSRAARASGSRAAGTYHEPVATTGAVRGGSGDVGAPPREPDPSPWKGAVAGPPHEPDPSPWRCDDLGCPSGNTRR